jgi:hypothetical protein
MKKNNLRHEDHDPAMFHDLLKGAKMKAFSEMTVSERIKYCEVRNIELHPHDYKRVNELYSKAFSLFSDNYAKPVGPLDLNHILIGEIHDQAENYTIYPQLLQGLSERGYNTLSFEYSLSKQSQDRLNEAFLLSGQSLSPGHFEGKMIQEGIPVPLVYAMRNNLRVVFVDHAIRDMVPWDREMVPSVPFDPSDPTTIVDGDCVRKKAQKDAEIFDRRNQFMAENIELLGDEKVVHVGGRGHNKGLQALLDQRTGKTPLSLLIDYPSYKVQPHDLETSHSFRVEYVRDILTLVDNLTESSPSRALASVPVEVEDSPGSEACSKRVRNYLLSGLVGQIMTKAAGLSKGAPEHQSRIFMTMLIALSQVSVLNIDLEKSKEILSVKREREEKEILASRKKRDKEKQEQERLKKLEELEEKLKEEESPSDVLSIFSVFRNLISAPSVAPMVAKNPIPSSPQMGAKWLMEEAGVDVASYYPPKNQNIDKPSLDLFIS